MRRSGIRTESPARPESGPSSCVMRAQRYALFGELMMRDYEGPPPTSTLNSSSDEDIDKNEEASKTVAAVTDEPEPTEK